VKLPAQAPDALVVSPHLSELGAGRAQLPDELLPHPIYFEVIQMIFAERKVDVVPM
jgi:hypothetical protein